MLEIVARLKFGTALMGLNLGHTVRNFSQNIPVYAMGWYRIS